MTCKLFDLELHEVIQGQRRAFKRKSEVIPGSSYQMAFSLQRPSGTLAVKEYHTHPPLLSLTVMVSPGNWFPTSGDPFAYQQLLQTPHLRSGPGNHPGEWSWDNLFLKEKELSCREPRLRLLAVLCREPHVYLAANADDPQQVPTLRSGYCTMLVLFQQPCG